MQLFRILAVLAAVVLVGTQYLLEHHRLSVVQRLPGQKAREHYESRRRRSDRLMPIITALFAALGVGAVIYLLAFAS
jgi:hypothetical protein